MANSVDLKFVSELFDGRYFLVPAYQRGYRWEAKQVESLLMDLYSFYITSGKTDFCCLQPIIVQKVTDQSTIDDVQNNCSITIDNDLEHDKELEKSLDAIINGTTATNSKHTLWEVVDGQQRLTTLYILYSYLLSIKFPGNLKMFAQFNKKALYSLYYESRPNSYNFIKQIGPNSQPIDIDETYMKEAYDAIDKWILNKSGKIPLFAGKTPQNIIDGLFDLLNGNQTSQSVKVIWYEIDPKNKNIIKEFLDANTGKIGLTDSELVKALFLQDRGNSISVDQIALEWEHIENMLNQSSFWSFLSKKEDTEQHERITLLLDIMYELNASNPTIKEDNYLFDYYYTEVFSQIPPATNVADVQKFVEDEWQKIVVCARTLEDWYNNPAVYNYVGFLTQFDTKIWDIYKIFNEPKIVTYDDFVKRLKIEAKKKVKYTLDPKTGLITNKYGEPVIKRILLFANVNQLNNQFINSGHICSQIYKFPFDVFLSQKWNVEHIDSQTANDMKDNSDKRVWIDTAEKSFPDLLKDTDYLSVKNSNDLDETISFIQRWLGEDSEDKHSIGNLALLDAKTNISYGNALFVQKRAVIAAKVKDGQFVPLCTQWAFNKHYTQNTVPDLTRWTKADKENYNRFILKNIQ